MESLEGGGRKHNLTSGGRSLHEMEEAINQLTAVSILLKNLKILHKQNNSNLCGWFQVLLLFTFGFVPNGICFSLGDFSPIFCNHVGRFRV